MALPQQNPLLVQQRLVIPNKRGEKLVGILHESGTRDVVVLCHGDLCSKDTDLIVNLAVALENVKISSFRFDFSGNGESEGSKQYNGFWTEVDDLLAVTQHFRESNRQVSAIVGHSKGGSIVLMYASKDHDIEKVVNISGCYDIKRGVEILGKDALEKIWKYGYVDLKQPGGNYIRITEESLKELLAINMHDLCLQIHKDCRVLTVHGTSDEINPVKDAFAFDKVIPNHKLHIIEGADHRYHNHQGELSLVVENFIKETLRKAKGTDGN